MTVVPSFAAFSCRKTVHETPSQSMEFLVNHTWSIHRMTPCTVPLSQSVSSMEESASNLLRQGHRAAARPQSKKRRDDDPEGNYVRITWIGDHISGGSIATDQDEGNEAQASRKRSRGDTQQQQHASSDIIPLHLRVEVFLQEQWSAEVIFCAASRDTPKNKIDAFAFCLARGLKSSYGEIWMWFESITGGSVGKVPLGPSSEELANLVALWTKKDYEQCGVERTGQNSSSPKPLVLTFSVPFSLEGSGLDNLSLTVPPASLLQLCTNIEEERLKKRQKIVSATRNGTLDDISSEDEASEGGLPILKAMQCYIQEAFRINIKSFSLVKASCAVASFGCDGRCKPLSLALLPDVLQEIQTITHNRYARESYSAAARDDDDISSD
jgi:hypothetical protein